jgi:hypothetical protein
MYALVCVCGFAFAANAYAIDTVYSVSARGDLRTRSLFPGDRSGFATADFEVQATAGLALSGGTSRFGIELSPTVLFREPHRLGPVQPLYRAMAGFDERWTGGAFRLSEEFAFGIIDVGLTRTPEGTLPGGAPVIETQAIGPVPYLRTATRAALDTTLAQSVIWGADVSYVVSGGLGTPALPLQYGPSGGMRLSWAPTTLDVFTTSASAAYAEFSTKQTQALALLSETWQRRIVTDVRLELLAGAAFAREVIPPGLPAGLRAGTYQEILPVIQVSSVQVLPVRGIFTLSELLRMAPFADRFTGHVYERAEALVSARWNIERAIEGTVSTGGALAVPLGNSTQAGDRVVFAEGVVTWTITPWLSTQTTVRVSWSEQPRLGTPGLVQWLANFGIVVRDQGVL